MTPMAGIRSGYAATLVQESNHGDAYDKVRLSLVTDGQILQGVRGQFSRVVLPIAGVEQELLDAARSHEISVLNMARGSCGFQMDPE